MATRNPTPLLRPAARRIEAALLPFLGVGLLTGLLVADASYAATIFDPVAEFSLTTNTDASTWSYRFSTDEVRDGAYSLFTTVSAGANFWNPDHPYWFEVNQFHGIGANNTGGTITGDTFVIPWPDATIWMHPGTFVQGTPGGPGFTVLSWLAPDDGTIDLSFTFSDMDPGIVGDPQVNDGIAWYVDLGDSSGVIAAGMFDNAGTSGLQTHDGIAVQGGDRLHFIVDPIDGNRFGDSTLFTGSIDFTAVPEPTTALLLATGLAGLAARRRRLH